MIKEIDLETVYTIRHKAMYPDHYDLVRVPGDDKAVHLGYFHESICVSTISLFISNEETQIRKFATLLEFQNKGFGSHLLTYVLRNYNGTFFLNARDTKISYYKKFGFVETEKTFKKNHNSYTIMRKIKEL